MRFPLRCFQRLSRTDSSYRAMPLAGQLIHHRSAHPGPLVLGTTPLNSPAPTLDRDRTVSQRSEPSSRTALMGEQPNPWEVLPPQDATSRHRAISAVTGGADYLSTLFGCRRMRVPASDSDHRFVPAGLRSPSHRSDERISRYGVMSGNLYSNCGSRCGRTISLNLATLATEIRIR